MKRYIGEFYLCMAFMLAGSSVVAARYVSDSLGTFTITAISLGFAVLGLLPACIGKLNKSLKGMGLKAWMLVCFQALFGIFLFRMFLLNGLLRTTSGEAGILTGVTPAATVLIAWVFLKEPLKKADLGGLICTVSGIFVLQGILQPSNLLNSRHIAGNLLVILAALCESIFNVFSKLSSFKSSQKGNLDPVVQTFLVSGAALVLCLIPMYRENPVKSLTAIGIGQWLALVWYGLFVTALAFIFWYAGIKRSKITVAAAFSGMMPLTSLVLSVIILGERPGWQQWIGGLLIVSGMLLAGTRDAVSERPEVNAEDVRI